MQFVVRLTSFLPLFLYAICSHANDRNDLLSTEIGGYQVSTAFSAYVFFEGDSTFRKQLKQAIQQQNNRVAALNRFPEVKQQWQLAADFINDNEEAAGDGTDRRLDTSLAVYMNELYRRIRTALETQPRGLSSGYLETRLQFEKVVAQYIGYTSTSMGVYHSDETIEESVAKYSQLLEQTRNKNRDYKALVRKWNFIKKSMLAGTSAPFVTLHTAQKIRQLMADVYGEKLS